ncbi:MAG: DMT family transporter [Candidatus Omnitrophota bacterium]
MKNQSVPFAAKLSLISACLLWAASFIATKTALNTVPPLTVVVIRLMVSSACFIVWLMVKKKKIPYLGPKWMGQMFLLSLFGTGLHYSIQTIGITYTTASNASLYAATGPICITIIAAFFLRERITLKKALGIGCAFLGVLIVQGFGVLKAFDLRGHLMGDVLVFVSIFMWGLFTVLGKDMMQRMDAFDLTAVATFMGSIYMLPISWYELRNRSFSFSSISGEAWGAIAFLGVTCSFLATILYFFALEKAESQKVGVYLYTIPPMSYVIAALVLHESIGAGLLIGSLVVLTGVYITERG